MVYYLLSARAVAKTNLAAVAGQFVYIAGNRTT